MTKEDKQGFNDERVKYIQNIVQSSIKSGIDANKWEKFWNQDESVQPNNMSMILAFLESEETSSCYFYISAGSGLSMQLTPPSSFTGGKYVFFTKAPGFPVVPNPLKTKDAPFQESLMFGDVCDDATSIGYKDATQSSSVIGSIRISLNEIYLPLLKSKLVNEKWPEMLKLDAQKQINKLAQSVHIVEGKIQGRFTLPFPQNVDALHGAINKAMTDLKAAANDPSYIPKPMQIVQKLTKDEKEAVQEVESTVLEWLKQIRQIKNLKIEDVVTSSEAFPTEELSFWGDVNDNIIDIVRTLEQPEAIKIFEILKNLNSTYETPLRDSQEELLTHFVEIHSNFDFLRPLVNSNYPSTLAGDSSSEEVFAGCAGSIVEGLKNVWKHAPFYCKDIKSDASQTRFIFLVRSLCNHIISQLRTRMGMSDIIGGQEAEPKIDLCKQSIVFLTKLKESYAKAFDEFRNNPSINDNDAAQQKNIIERMKRQFRVENKIVNKNIIVPQYLYVKKEGDNKQVAIFDYSVQEAPQDQKKYVFAKGPWPGQNLVFKRLDAFIERIRDILKFWHIKSAMSQLEKFSVGGPQGQVLVEQVNQIYQIFKSKESFNSDTDPTNLNDKNFERDFNRFMKHYNSWEHRLLSVLEIALTQVVTIDDAISTIELFGDILPDTVMQSIVASKFSSFCELFMKDLMFCDNDFNEKMVNPPLQPQTPYFSGRVMWARVLLNKARSGYIKIQELYEVFQTAIQVDMSSGANQQKGDDSYQNVRKRFADFAQDIAVYENKQFKDWSESLSNQSGRVIKTELGHELLIAKQVIIDLPETINQKMSTADDQGQYELLVIPELADVTVTRKVKLDKPQLLQTNFSDKIESVLQEVKFFKILGRLETETQADMTSTADAEKIPSDAAEVYKRADIYREIKNVLDDIVSKYNSVQRELVFAERPLFYWQMEFIDKKIDEIIDPRLATRLTWFHLQDRQSEIKRFIDDVQNPVNVLYRQVIHIKECRRSIEVMLRSWAKVPMIDRLAKNPIIINQQANQAQQVSVSDMITTRCQQFKKESLQKIKREVTYGEGETAHKDSNTNGNIWYIDMDLIALNVINMECIVNLVQNEELVDIFQLDEKDKKIREQYDSWVGEEKRAHASHLERYWENYLVWLTEYVKNGLLEIILANIENLQQLMDEAETLDVQDFYNKNINLNDVTYPLLEIALLIRAQRIYFEPSLQKDDATRPTLEITIFKWIDEICNICKVPNTPTITIKKEARLRNCIDYNAAIKKDTRFIKSVQTLIQRIIRRSDLGFSKLSVINPYRDYFTLDKKGFLQKFLLYGPNVPLSGELSQEVIEQKQTQMGKVTRMKFVRDDFAADDEGEKKEETKPQETTQLKQVDENLAFFRKPDLYDFNDSIEKYDKILTEVQNVIPQYVRLGWLNISFRQAKTQLLSDVEGIKRLFVDYLINDTKNTLEDLKIFVVRAQNVLSATISPGETFEEAMKIQQDIEARSKTIDKMFEPIKEKSLILQKHGIAFDEKTNKLVETLPKEWQNIKQLSFLMRDKLAPLQKLESENLSNLRQQFSQKVSTARSTFQQDYPFRYSGYTVQSAYLRLDVAISKTFAFQEEAMQLLKKQLLFDSTPMLNKELINDPSFQKKQMEEFAHIEYMVKELRLVKQVWDLLDSVECQLGSWRDTLFSAIDTEALDANTKKLITELNKLDRMSKTYPVYGELDQMIKNFQKTVPLIGLLRSDAMKERHWQQLKQKTGVGFVIDGNSRLKDLMELNLHNYADIVADIVNVAEKENKQEGQLTTLEKTWEDQRFAFVKHKDMNPMTADDLVKAKANPQQLFNVLIPDELVAQLETDQLTVQAMASNKQVQFFAHEVTKWQTRLAQLDSIIQTWSEVQRTWQYLHPIFIEADDIKKQLPDDAKRFEQIHNEWVKLMNERIVQDSNLKAKNIADQAQMLTNLEKQQKELVRCEKALNDYLDKKRRLFPRFYFMSPVDLLDMLSKGGTPKAVEKHLSKIFDSIEKLQWDGPAFDCKLATAMYSKQNEHIPFKKVDKTGSYKTVVPAKFDCSGNIEVWLNRLVDTMRETLTIDLNQVYAAYDQIQQQSDKEDAKKQWLIDNHAQTTLVALQLAWTSDTTKAFEALSNGTEGAMKEYNKQQFNNLQNYIRLVQGDLSKDQNALTKISTICTIEVHAYEIVAKMIRDKIDSATLFAWQSQLRFYQSGDGGQVDAPCLVNICDAKFVYSYEYLGCTARLVITPLTDRCYITLTQSLHLNLGGAPAGPAGTGKTETTKDLGRALGRMVYVFNCSPEMDYKSLGNIFYGLSLSGSWGCFDEFNRISIEVLSVVATQVKCVLDAIRAKKEFFSLDGEEKPDMPPARLNTQVGYFITMNPGYAGRTELPDNLKALFRSVSMIVPDSRVITQIQLMSNGFQCADILAKKFTTLYSLNKELLSKQDHYDWGLRAIIAICRTAGNLRREMIPSEDSKKK